jgi:UDP-N-acetylmuramyl pentapeptide phosphotransferase/UDP-N-acetylglucosamine-1-phosphate transferase
VTLRLLAGLAAALVLGALATRLRGSANTNYRGRTVSLAGGLAAIAVAALGGLSRHDRTGAAILVAALAAGAVGRYDDVKGTTDKGLRGHLRALRHGNVTSGAAKVAVVGLAALAAAAILDKAGPRLLIDAVLVAGTANLLNLFDLRPGRALKVATIASLALLGTDAWLAGAGLGLLPYDLRERTMLGDGGANALGAALGVTIAAAARPLAVAIPLAVALIAATLASEVVSFSKVIDAVRPLRWADRLGRPA